MARVARDDDGTAGRAVDQHAQIQLAFDLEPFLDEHTSDLPALRTGLVRDERHPDHLFRQALGFIGRFRQLDPAALAAAPRMDLRLHDDDAGAETQNAQFPDRGTRDGQQSRDAHRACGFAA